MAGVTLSTMTGSAALVVADLDHAYVRAVGMSEFLKTLAQVMGEIGMAEKGKHAANAVHLHDELIELVTQAQTKGVELIGCLETINTTARFSPFSNRISE